MTEAPKISSRNSVKIVLNHKGIRNLMAHEDVYKILETKGKKIETTLKKNFGRVEVRKTNATDGRAAIFYVVKEMSKADFKNSTLQKALLNAKMRPGKRR
jgi:hypothetical protein